MWIDKMNAILYALSEELKERLSKPYEVDLTFDFGTHIGIFKSNNCIRASTSIIQNRLI